MINLWFPKSLFPKIINVQLNKINKKQKHDYRSIQAVKENRKKGNRKQKKNTVKFVKSELKTSQL